MASSGLLPASMSIAKPACMLTTSAEWREWYFIIQQAAKQLDVWELCDPDTSTVSAKLAKPTAPKVSDVRQGAIDLEDLDDDDYKKYQRRKEVYKDKQTEWKDQHNKLSQINNLILLTVASTNHVWIMDKDSAFEKLQSLKNKLAPTDMARKLLVRSKYLALSKIGSQDIDIWVDEWTHVLKEAEALKLPEMQDGQPTFLFLLAIKTASPEFSMFQRARLESLMIEGKALPDNFEIVTAYIQHRRINQALNVPDSQESTVQPAAFATLKGERDGRDRKKCVCNFQHKLEDCYYLHESLRPTDWKPKPEVEKTIQDKIEGDKALAQRLKILCEKVKNESAKDKGLNQASKKPEDRPKIFATQFLISNTCFPQLNQDKSDYQDQNSEQQSEAKAFATQQQSNNISTSWILDTGAEIHICNSLERFVKTRDSQPGESIMTGLATSKICAWGTVTIQLNDEDGPFEIELTNTAYTPDFLVNCVSGDLLELKKVYYDGEHSRLRYKDSTFAKITKIGGLRFLVNNSTAPTHKVFATTANLTPTRITTAERWHQTLGHLGKEVIERLEKATEGGIVTKSTSGPTTIDCEPCSLSKAHQIVSRRSDHQEDSNEPFERLG